MYRTSIEDETMTNLELMRKRLEYRGGVSQVDRMIKDKYRSFLSSLKASYQSGEISLVQHYKNVLDAFDSEMSVGQVVPALINQNKIKQDYDDKILSVDFNANLQTGDIIQWKGTDSYWIIYLQELTEKAYFLGDIRRCKYQIKFKDAEGNWCKTWAAIRGPVETKIDTHQKSQLRIDSPNLSLNILIPANDKTKSAFDRYSEFIFKGKSWKVQAVDNISMTNVLEVNAEEAYINKDKDDLENEIKDGLVIETFNLPKNYSIQGESFIKPNITEIYSVDEIGGNWSVESNCPVTLKKINETSVEVTWKKMVSGQFILRWTKGEVVEERTIIVESLF